ncbi:MAG TPA: YihY/virulence factor BrkB family protein [Jatrophihabitans sp.]|nr:YihY/virulence factor BrkB family protein [Jatrophihabitans sp.]
MILVRRVLRAVRLVPLLLKRTVVKAWHDRVLGLSAEAAFWQMLSLPSLFLALLATLGYVSRWFGARTVTSTETQIEHTLSRAFNEEVVQKVIAPILREVLSGGRADVISIGFALALWAGSSATATFVNTITIAYDQRDLRGPVHSRLLALWLFLGTVVLGVILLPMLVLGPDLLRRAFPASVRPAVSTLISVGYYPTLILLLLLGLTTFYKLAPPRRLPWHRGIPGAGLAVLVFLAGSIGLRGYISFIVDHNHAYGTLAAPIAALLFFFVLALGVLLGAEFNATIEEYKPTPEKPPRVLDPRSWQLFQPNGEQPPIEQVPLDQPRSEEPQAREVTKPRAVTKPREVTKRSQARKLS